MEFLENLIMHVEPSSLDQSREGALPPGVTRCRYAGRWTTLENCEAVQLFVAPLENSGASRSFIIWKGPQSPHAVDIRPVSKRRIRDLRAGDTVTIAGVETEVVGLEVWR